MMLASAHRRAALSVAAVALVAFGLPRSAAAAPASTSFGTPTATSTFLQGIAFVQPATLPSVPKRVEILVQEPDVAGAAVTEVQPPDRAGDVQLRTVLDTSHGQLVTNTTVTARWRVTYPDGTSETGPSTTVTYADTRFAWRTMSGAVVRIHWYDGSDQFGRQAVSLGDGAIARAAKLLGVQVTQPIDFFIYADQAAFSAALGPGAHENVAGEAHPEIRTMFGLITPDEIGTSEVSRVVTHELTHLVFHAATKNPYHAPLHWLDEGVAVYLSEGFGPGDRGLVTSAVADRTIMPLAALTGDWPSDYDRFSLAYAEAVSAVDFIVRTQGQASLVKLIRSYAQGVTDDEAFQAALRLDTKGFDAAWLASVGASTPPSFGPRPAPPGPTPAGWTTAGASAAPAGLPAAGSPAASGFASPAAAIASPAPSPVPAANASGIAGAAIPGAIILVAVAALSTLLLRSRRPRGAGR